MGHSEDISINLRHVGHSGDVSFLITWQCNDLKYIISQRDMSIMNSILAKCKYTFKRLWSDTLHSYICPKEQAYTGARMLHQMYYFPIEQIN